MLGRKFPQEHVRFDEERRRLIALASEDQKDRADPAFLKGDTNTMQQFAVRDQARADEALKILERVKTPSRRNIGMEGSRAMWLLAMHSPLHKSLGKKVLTKMKRLYSRDKNSVFAAGIPYLTDRMRIYPHVFDHNRTQVYGTQKWAHRRGDGTMESGVYPVQNPTELGVRLAEFGIDVHKRCKYCRHRP